VRPPLPAPAFPDGIVLRELNVAADATARHAADTIAFPAASGYIDILAVSPGERRRGLRMTLLRTIFANCAVAGLREVALGVASDTPHAQRLYRRAGWPSATGSRCLKSTSRGAENGSDGTRTRDLCRDRAAL
jgi:ribosomal protein S18 acetylase RimI-like enzyme